MKIKSGEDISFKEFIARWKQGILDISPIQKLENELRGTIITLVGFIVALGAVIWQIKAIGWLGYGLILIFLGSIVTTSTKVIGMKQQMKFFKATEGESIDISNLLNRMDEEKAKEIVEKEVKNE